MIRKNKLKVLAILTSLSLWLYVTIVVDPESNMKIESLPVNISNPIELTENNLLLSSDTKPTIDLFLEGKLSDLRNLKKENIRASIEIQNPSEGKNEANISVSVPNNIKYNLKESTITVQLEKNIHINKDILVQLPKGKDLNDYSIDLSYNKVKLSGPRSAIKRVDKVVANIKEDSFSLNKSFGVQLSVVDSRGFEVENVSLENSIIEVTIKKIESKEVSLNALFDKDINKSNYKLSTDVISVTGDISILDSLDTIFTKPINASELKDKKLLEVEIDLPNGVYLSDTDNKITIEFLK